MQPHSIDPMVSVILPTHFTDEKREVVQGILAIPHPASKWLRDHSIPDLTPSFPSSLALDDKTPGRRAKVGGGGLVDFSTPKSPSNSLLSGNPLSHHSNNSLGQWFST